MGNHDTEQQAHYELGVLDDLVLNNLYSECSNASLTTEQLGQWQEIARTQRGIIKKRLVSVAFSLDKEKRIRQYIHNHQSRLCYLIDSLIKFYQQERSSQNEYEYYRTVEIVCNVLLDLMQFLSNQFADYFNYDEKADISVKLDKYYIFREKADRIKQLVPDGGSELLRLAFEPVNEFLTRGSNNQPTFRTLVYYETLLNEIEVILKTEKAYDEPLKLVLISLNFNSMQFQGYLIQEIKKDLKKEESHSAKVSRLSWYLKNYNQVVEKPDFALKSRQPSIKMQINNWIVEEINYLEKRLQMAKTIISTSGLPDNFRFQTELSVAQIGYLLHLFFGVGVLRNQNQSDVIRFISNHTTTPQVGTVSPESLRTKFYNVESGTRSSVKEIIISLLNEINKSA